MENRLKFQLSKDYIVSDYSVLKIFGIDILCIWDFATYVHGQQTILYIFCNFNAGRYI